MCLCVLYFVGTSMDGLSQMVTHLMLMCVWGECARDSMCV